MKFRLARPTRYRNGAACGFAYVVMEPPTTVEIRDQNLQSRQQAADLGREPVPGKRAGEEPNPRPERPRLPGDLVDNHNGPEARQRSEDLAFGSVHDEERRRVVRRDGERRG